MASNLEGANEQQAQTDILARMKTKDLEDLTALAEHQTFKKGAYIFRVGTPGRNVYFLQTGRIKIYQPTSNGKEVIHWFCLKGELFGLAEVAHRGGRIVNARACEDSEVLCLSQSQLEIFLETHPSTAMLMMQVLSCRLRTLGDVIVNLVNDNVQTRIMKLILRLSARYGVRVDQDIYLNIHLTHQEIADMVGTTRQTVTSVLNELKRQGFLKLENQRIHIDSNELLDDSPASIPPH